MSASVEQLKATLSGLPVSERAELAQYLIRSLEQEHADAKSAWLAIAGQRMAQVRAGTVVGIPADEVLNSLPGRKP